MEIMDIVQQKFDVELLCSHPPPSPSEDVGWTPPPRKSATEAANLLLNINNLTLFTDTDNDSEVAMLSMEKGALHGTPPSHNQLNSHVHTSTPIANVSTPNKDDTCSLSDFKKANPGMVRPFRYTSPSSDKSSPVSSSHVSPKKLEFSHGSNEMRNQHADDDVNESNSDWIYTDSDITYDETEQEGEENKSGSGDSAYSDEHVSTPHNTQPQLQYPRELTCGAGYPSDYPRYLPKEESLLISLRVCFQRYSINPDMYEEPLRKLLYNINDTTARLSCFFFLYMNSSDSWRSDVLNTFLSLLYEHDPRAWDSFNRLFCDTNGMEWGHNYFTFHNGVNVSDAPPLPQSPPNTSTPISSSNNHDDDDYDGDDDDDDELKPPPKKRMRRE